MTLELTVEIDFATADRLHALAQQSTTPEGDQPSPEEVASDGLARWSQQTLKQLELAQAADRESNEVEAEADE